MDKKSAVEEYYDSVFHQVGSDKQPDRDELVSAAKSFYFHLDDLARFAYDRAMPNEILKTNFGSIVNKPLQSIRNADLVSLLKSESNGSMTLIAPSYDEILPAYFLKYWLEENRRSVDIVVSMVDPDSGDVLFLEGADETLRHANPISTYILGHSNSMETAECLATKLAEMYSQFREGTKGIVFRPDYTHIELPKLQPNQPSPS